MDDCTGMWLVFGTLAALLLSAVALSWVVIRGILNAGRLPDNSDEDQ